MSSFSLSWTKQAAYQHCRLALIESRQLRHLMIKALSSHPDFQDLDLFNTLVHVHSLAPRYKPGQTPDEVLVGVLEELKKVRLGIPEATATILKSGNDPLLVVTWLSFERITARIVCLLDGLIASWCSCRQLRKRNAQPCTQQWGSLSSICGFICLGWTVCWFCYFYAVLVNRVKFHPSLVQLVY